MIELQTHSFCEVHIDPNIWKKHLKCQKETKSIMEVRAFCREKFITNWKTQVLLQKKKNPFFLCKY